MKTETIKKPSCIVDFNNEAEIDAALLEAENDFKVGKFMTFDEFVNKTSNFKNNLFKNV